MAMLKCITIFVLWTAVCTPVAIQFYRLGEMDLPTVQVELSAEMLTDLTQVHDWIKVPLGPLNDLLLESYHRIMPRVSDLMTRFIHIDDASMISFNVITSPKPNLYILYFFGDYNCIKSVATHIPVDWKAEEEGVFEFTPTEQILDIIATNAEDPNQFSRQYTDNIWLVEVGCRALKDPTESESFEVLIQAGEGDSVSIWTDMIKFSIPFNLGELILPKPDTYGFVDLGSDQMAGYWSRHVCPKDYVECYIKCVLSKYTVRMVAKPSAQRIDILIENTKDSERYVGHVISIREAEINLREDLSVDLTTFLSSLVCKPDNVLQFGA